MNVVDFPIDQMLQVAEHKKFPRLMEALRLCQMHQLDPKSVYIPEQIRTLLKLAHQEKRFAIPVVLYAPFLAPMLLFSGIQQDNLPTLGMGALFLLGVPVALRQYWRFSPQWAVKQILELQQTSFVFVENNQIFANFPKLRDLEKEIADLKHNKENAQRTCQKIDQLAQTLKEKLILLGQNTNDPNLIQLETHKLNQIRLIEQSDELLSINQQKLHKLEKLRQEVIQWAELDWLKRQANELAGSNIRTQTIEKLTHLEMQAYDIQMEISQVHQELKTAIAEWNVQHEIQ